MASSARASLGSRRVAVFLAAAVLILAFASACTPGSSPSAPVSVKTGIRGHVLAGPTCPVEQAGQSACVKAVSGAVILARDAAGHEAGRTVSDATGAYSLPLPAGTYEIVPQAVEGLMSIAPSSSVTVTAGAPVQLDLQYDTGIR
jgi:hypothetical protein